MSDAHASPVSPRLHPAAAARVYSPGLQRLGGILALAAAYYGTAKLGQSLRYTGSVAAIWPPVGLGIAVLYVKGLQLWPGIFIGELVVNGELFFASTKLPLESLIGQQLGNIAEVVVGAWLLRRLIGPRARLDHARQVGGMVFAVAVATAISATIGTVSMLAGSVIELDDAATFWRTWWLGDSSGALVVLPLVLTWLADPRATARRVFTLEGAAMIATVAILATVAVTSATHLLYVTFPALIWAAFRFGPAGVTLASAINAGITIGITAHKHGAFFQQPIDDRTLSTQQYVLIGSLTALFLSAVVSEREHSAAEVVAARRRESERALEERRRIARDLHDSVSQALFSSMLHTRAAEKALAGDPDPTRAKVKESLEATRELTRQAQREMRRFIFEWGPQGIGQGLVSAFTTAAPALTEGSGIMVEIEGPDGALPLTTDTQTQLFGIGREALANVVKHSGAVHALIRVEVDDGRVILEIGDDGCGFDTATVHPGGFGLESMRSRASEIGADLEIWSRTGHGTLLRVDVPSEEQPVAG